MSILIIALGWWLIATGVTLALNGVAVLAVILARSSNLKISNAIGWGRSMFTTLAVPVGVALVLWGGAL